MEKYITPNLSQEHGLLELKFNNTDNLDGELQIETFHNSGFNNFYRIYNSIGKITKLSFYYDEGLFGYLCLEGCFIRYEGKVEKEFPIIHRELDYGKKNQLLAQKDYLQFNDTYIVIRYSPQSRKYILFEKIIDALMLGLAAAMLYDIIKRKR